MFSLSLAHVVFKWEPDFEEFLNYIEDPLLRKRVIADFLWFAELYCEDIRRRTLERLRRARVEGRRLGRPPYPFPAEEVRRWAVGGSA
ncbi:MAG: hypothetical protein LM564_05265 [Desulfurococcaceae archaeon]|jgi:DNA invertase Pin-like site-specific DNA recombinase|nr:hypothetical protein [Desulfurococcaceae archaeon]